MAGTQTLLKARLEEARSQGRIFKQRVLVPLTVGAASLIVLSASLVLALFSSCESALGLSELDCKRVRLLPLVLDCYVAPMLLLIVLPTQTRLIYVLNILLTPGGIFFGLVVGVEVFFWLGRQQLASGECTDFESVMPTPCRCIVAPLVVFGTCAVGCIYVSVAFLVLLLRRDLSSRKRLDGLWRTMRVAYLLGGIVPLGALVFERAHGICSNSGTIPRAYLWCQTVSATLVGALLSTPDFRARTHALLSSRSEASAVASGIASALSGRPIDELIEQAVRLFRGVRLDRVRAEHFVDSTRDATLYALSEPCHLLGCDAFVSHCWSDPPAAKWKALQLWRHQFVLDHGREPVVFIDKFCVAQTDDATIAVALECLPLWIAGCQQLVVLLGPQFLSRTWCLMELFTHLEMGGSSERITLLLVGNGPSAAARSVDVAASQCDRASDLEMMLAVIEASAGGSRAFNAQLELLLARLDVPVPLYAARGRARSRSSAARAATARASSFILITDPGPDPDDVKALLIAAVLHAQGQALLRAVVANGGRARDRARLARCVLDHVGATDVPVGIGSDGATEVVAQPHEYELPGYAAVADAQLQPGARVLLEALARAPDKSVSVVCISSLTDFASLCAAQPELVRRKVCALAVQGGLVADARSPSGWAPDTSQNNEFDRAAAAFTYDWCFAHGLPMTVTSRHAVPVIPMQLARSFAERTDCPVMRYLASAQFLGLEGLWVRLCDGKLPERCDKQWYFETFCGVDAAMFAKRKLSRLTRADPILPYLDGVVKPYDVVALMTVIPQARGLFSEGTIFEYKGVEHLLLLQPEHAIPAAPVITLLREVYHEVVLATARIGMATRLQAERAQGGVCSPLQALRRAVARLLGCERAHRRRSAAVSGKSGSDASSGARLIVSAPHMAGRKALRTDMRQVLSALGDAEVAGGGGRAGSGGSSGRRAARVEPHEVELLLGSALDLVSERRARVDVAAFLFASASCTLVVVALFGGGQTSQYEFPSGALEFVLQFGWALTIANAGTIALLLSIGLRPGPRVSLLIAAYMAGVALMAAFVVSLTHRRFGERMRSIGADAVQSVQDGGDVRALGRVLCELFFFVCLITITTFGIRGLGAICWSACAPPRRLPPRALSGASFVRSEWSLSVGFSLWMALLPWWRASKLGGEPSNTFQHRLDAGCAVLNAFIFVLCVSPAARRGIESVAARAFGARGAVASLAPLLGYGSAIVPEPDALVLEAQRLFRVVTLGPDARAALAATADAARAAAALGRDLEFDPAATERRSRRGALYAAHAARADVFACCTRVDEPAALGALCAWAERFETKAGRPPTVWLSALCADLSLSSTELLAQLPCYLTRCETLLLLASPRMPLDLHAVITIHTWRTLGDPLASSIEVVLAGGAAERDATVAAFDSFHVMHASADEGVRADGDAAGTGADERANVAERLELSAQLATSFALNVAMRELLPAVYTASAAEGVVTSVAVRAAQRPVLWAKVAGQSREDKASRRRHAISGSALL